MLTLLEGPAGSNKSAAARRMIQAGEADVVADVTPLWAALRGVERGPDGKFPVRADDDPALPLARYLQAAAVREGLREGRNVVVTTSRRGQAPRWQAVAAETGDELTVRTLDVDRATIAARLAGPGGELSPACQAAMARWFG